MSPSHELNPSAKHDIRLDLRDERLADICVSYMLSIKRFYSSYIKVNCKINLAIAPLRFPLAKPLMIFNYMSGGMFFKTTLQTYN